MTAVIVAASGLSRAMMPPTSAISPVVHEGDLCSLCPVLIYLVVVKPMKGFSLCAENAADTRTTDGNDKPAPSCPVQHYHPKGCIARIGSRAELPREALVPHPAPVR
jgi:hypothetical protein